MARKRRRWNPERFDHVVMRGNNRQDIFHDRGDISSFFRAMHYTYSKYPFTILAYCIMTNHYHLLIRSPEVPLGQVMGYLNRRYSDAYKKKYNYSGHLYESRYFSEMASSPRSLLLVSRYIHRNPINTKIPMVKKMEDYLDSSFYLYKNEKESPYPYLDLELLPSFLSEATKQNRQAYCLFCEEEKEGNLESHPQGMKDT
ncbi:transposase [Sporosarcina sp. 179-K 3D1 HS]|uniref:transposase n=1 Tax=Sporosarcina sp. 179-K 3D1 HS TaxID=3232169 RepID=UPI0039A07A36